jgi:hypothetical protein
LCAVARVSVSILSSLVVDRKEVYVVAPWLLIWQWALVRLAELLPKIWR